MVLGVPRFYVTSHYKVNENDKFAGTFTADVPPRSFFPHQLYVRAKSLPSGGREVILVEFRADFNPRFKSRRRATAGASTVNRPEILGVTFHPSGNRGRKEEKLRVRQFPRKFAILAREIGRALVYLGSY